MKRLIAAVSLGFLLATPAMAKKDKKGKEDTEEGAKSKLKPIKETGLKSIDGTFMKVKEIDDRLTNAKTRLRDSRLSLNEALELEKGTPITDALAELKKKANGKLKVSMDRNKIPKLEPGDGMPSNLRNALTATNNMMAGIAESTADVAAIPGEVKGLIKEAKAAPSKIKDEMKNAKDIKMKEFPKIAATVKNNVAVTVGLPEKAKQVATRMADITKVVADLAPPMP